MRWVGYAAAIVAGLLLASCRFIPTGDVPALANAAAPAGAGSFDPDKMVASIWLAKIVPYFEGGFICRGARSRGQIAR